MSGPQVTPSWALQQTSESVLLITRGVLQAATSDNIQPLALLVAEAFGNTLAICQQTQMLVEREAGKRHVSHVIRFLQAQVGYAANDPAAQLSSTSAGVRFLSLVTALLCTSSTFMASQAIQLMIKATSSDEQLFPTVIQMQTLIKALEYKLNKLGFSDSIAGWESYIDAHLNWPLQSRLMESKV